MTDRSEQIVMRAEEFDVHIKVWGDQGLRQLRGQLLQHNAQEFVRSAQFHLLRDGALVESTATDELGEFYFSDVPEGNLGFQISLPHLTVAGGLRFQETH
jgi:hypothetical protein